MHTQNRHDRLLGQALSEMPRSTLLIACLALGAIAAQAALLAAHFAAPWAAEKWGWQGLADYAALFDMTQGGSLGAWLQTFLAIQGILLCLLLARLDRTRNSPSLAWKWGAAAFAVLALDATCGLRGMLADLLESGALGLHLDPAFFVPATFLLLFGGFFGIALWRLRQAPMAAFGLLLGYGAWALAALGLEKLSFPELHLSAAEQAAAIPALGLLGTTLILWALFGNLFASARRNTPLALRQGLRF